MILREISFEHSKNPKKLECRNEDFKYNFVQGLDPFCNVTLLVRYSASESQN